MGDIEEYPFSFMNTPESLQILASAEVALMLWRFQFAITSRRHSYWLQSVLDTKLSCEKILLVPVPPRIRAQIDEKIATIRSELRYWSTFRRHIGEAVFDGWPEATFCKCFKHMVVDPFGGICFKATALNVLNSSDINDVEKYRLACVCCFADEITRLWPLVAEDKRVGAKKVMDEDSLMFYWNRRMKSTETTIEDTLSVERRLENTRKASNWPAFEYFWRTYANDGLKISQAVLFVKNTDDEGVKRTLPTLNRVLAGNFIEKVARPQLLRMLVLNEKYNDQDVFQLWARIGHIFYENEFTFCDVLFELWEMILHSGDYERSSLNNTQCGQINDILLEIWSEASEDLKDYVSKHRAKDFFDAMSHSNYSFIRFKSNYGHDMTFLLELLSKWRDVNREQLWQENWKELALRSKPLYFEKFMRMCLPNCKIQFFKNQLAEFESLFRLLIEEGFYSDLKDYLLFCSKDAKQFQQLAIKVLESTLYSIIHHDDDEFAKFNWFVGEVFSKVQKDVDEFKLQMVSSPKCLKHLLAARQTDTRKISSNYFSKIIERFVTNEGELQHVKRKLFEHCRTYLVDYKYNMFNADQWQEVLEWCTDDPEEISTFKRSLNVDVIFLERLSRYRSRGFFGYLDFLDKFLNWYFGNEEDAKNFKLEKVKNYKQLDIFGVEIEENRHIYRNDVIRKLLMWLFDYNKKNVREFCETCNLRLA